MIKYLILACCVAGAGALGYAGERFLRPTEAPEPNSAAAEKQDLLFRLPLGKFTMQVLQNREILHIVFDMDVYVMGAAAFDEVNGSFGRARLRDATVAAIAELAETEPGLTDAANEEARKQELSDQIVRKLYLSFPSIRAARMNSYIAKSSIRE